MLDYLWTVMSACSNPAELFLALQPNSWSTKFPFCKGCIWTRKYDHGGLFLHDCFVCGQKIPMKAVFLQKLCTRDQKIAQTILFVEYKYSASSMVRFCFCSSSDADIQRHSPLPWSCVCVCPLLFVLVSRSIGRQEKMNKWEHIANNGLVWDLFILGKEN